MGVAMESVVVARRAIDYRSVTCLAVLVLCGAILVPPLGGPEKLGMSITGAVVTIAVPNGDGVSLALPEYRYTKQSLWSAMLLGWVREQKLRASTGAKEEVQKRISDAEEPP
jgi:hypothetical protein